MLKANIALFAVFLLFAQCCFCNTTSNASAAAWGGNITQISLTLNQTSNRWFVFYGNSTGASTTLNLTPSMIYDSTDASHMVNLPTTYGYYVISDDSSPFDGQYSTPDLAAVDSHFNLRNYESTSYVFDGTSVFTVYNSSNATSVGLTLPTAYFAGQNNDSSRNWSSFRQGVVMKGSSILFIVPSSAAKGFDGREFDFEFALPYDQFGGNSFYIFSVAEPYTPPPALIPGGASPMLGDLGFSWSYDGKTLKIYTVSGSTVTLRDSLGASFSADAAAEGEYSFNVPAGFKYYAYITKPGYDRLDTNVYVPLPVNYVPMEAKTEKEEGAPPQVTIEKTPTGTLICIGGECYESDFAQVAKVQELKELSCYGSICRFVGIDGAGFVEKYDLKKSPIRRTARGQSAAPLDFGKMFSDFGYEVSSSLGSVTAWPEKDRGFFLYAFLFFAVAAILVYIYKQSFAKASSGEGYD